jgi:hypothetical protein
MDINFQSFMLSSKTYDEFLKKINVNDTVNENFILLIKYILLYNDTFKSLYTELFVLNEKNSYLKTLNIGTTKNWHILLKKRKYSYSNKNNSK